MLSNDNFIKINLTPEYKRNLKNLAKKYRHIRSDTQAIFVELQIGNFIGDKLSGFQLEIYKIRVKNSDIKKGWLDAMDSMETDKKVIEMVI